MPGSFFNKGQRSVTNSINESYQDNLDQAMNQTRMQMSAMTLDLNNDLGSNGNVFLTQPVSVYNKSNYKTQTAAAGFRNTFNVLKNENKSNLSKSIDFHPETIQ